MSSCLAAALASMIACDPCEAEPDEDTVKHEGAKLYDYEAWGTTITIYRDNGGAVQLVQVDRDPPSKSETQRFATLTTLALELLDATQAEVKGGAAIGGFDPQCLGFHDAPVARLWLPVHPGGLEFGYPWGCPPAGLAQLDAMLQELVLKLPECAESTLFVDCREQE